MQRASFQPFQLRGMPPRQRGPIGPRSSRDSISCNTACRRASCTNAQGWLEGCDARESNACASPDDGARARVQRAAEGVPDCNSSGSRKSGPTARRSVSHRRVTRKPLDGRTRPVCSGENAHTLSVFSPTAMTSTPQVRAESVPAVPRTSFAVSIASVKDNGRITTSTTL